MKYVFFDDFRPGILIDEMVFDVTSCLAGCTASSPQDVLLYVIAHHEELLPRFERAFKQTLGIPVGSVRLRPPVPLPTQLLCAIRNYIEEGRVPEGEFFLKSPTSIVGPGDVVELPDVPAKVFQHEAELAVVMKQGGRRIPAEQALNYVFGYTGFIDVSARGAGSSFHMRKSYETFGPMGPALVTADEIPDPHDLRVRLWVNGDLRQDYTTADMANRIERLIEVASSISSLLPGDVISTGTHHKGLGPLQDGDCVEFEIERIGRMTVTVRDPLRRVWDVK